MLTGLYVTGVISRRSAGVFNAIRLVRLRLRMQARVGMYEGPVMIGCYPIRMS